MKQIALVMTILTLFSQETNASSSRIPYREICNQINHNFYHGSNGALCADVIASNRTLPAFARAICDDVINKYETDLPRGRSYCEKQFKEIHADDNEAGVLPVFTNSVGLPTPRLRQSIAAEQCEQKTTADFFCRIDTDLILPDMASLFQSMSALPFSVSTNRLEFSPAKCSCLEDSVASSNRTLNLSNLENSLSTERKRINDLIFNAAGKKLINDFASNLEDFNFFDTNIPRLLGRNEEKSPMACNQFSDFRNTIMEKCRTSGIHANVAEQRLDKLMNSLGDLGSHTSAEQSFNLLRNDIMTYQLDPSDVFPGRSATFTRMDYDRFRYGIYNTRPEIKFINDITDLFLDDRTIGPQILSAIQAGTPPGRALYQFLGNESNPETQRILNRYLRRNNNSAFHRNLKAVMETTSTEDYGLFLKNTWDVATDMHPGLKAIFKNRDLFLATREKMESSGSHSILQALENSPGSLQAYFQEKCEKIKNDFAEATCTPDEDHISRTNRDDLAQLLSTVDSQLNPALTDVLLCRMPESNPNESIFTRLAFKSEDRINQADYFLMKVNPKDSTATRFTQVAHSYSSGDEKTFLALSKITETGDAFRSQLAEVTPTTEVQEVVTNVDNLSRLNDFLQQSSDSPNLPGMEQPVNNYIVPQAAAAPVQEPSVRNNENSARNMLRDFLADKDNQEEVDQLLRNTKSEDHQELLRLRQELQQNRSTISELMQESERMRLAELRRNYEALEKEVTEVSQANNQSRTVSDPMATQVAASTEVASPIRNLEAPPLPSQSSGIGSGSGSAGSAGVGGGTAGIRRSIASEMNSASPIQGPETGAIIIESSAVRGNEISSRGDISAEVISYLEKTQPDIATLKQLKESGIILKFKVMENGQEATKELKVDYAALSPEARSLLESRINLQEKTLEMEAVRRAYSFSALKHLLGIKSSTN